MRKQEADNLMDSAVSDNFRIWGGPSTIGKKKEWFHERLLTWPTGYLSIIPLKNSSVSTTSITISIFTSSLLRSSLPHLQSKTQKYGENHNEPLYNLPRSQQPNVRFFRTSIGHTTKEKNMAMNLKRKFKSEMRRKRKIKWNKMSLKKCKNELYKLKKFVRKRHNHAENTHINIKANSKSRLLSSKVILSSPDFILREISHYINKFGAIYIRDCDSRELINEKRFCYDFCSIDDSEVTILNFIPKSSRKIVWKNKLSGEFPFQNYEEENSEGLKFGKNFESRKMTLLEQMIFFNISLSLKNVIYLSSRVVQPQNSFKCAHLLALGGRSYCQMSLKEVLRSRNLNHSHWMLFPKVLLIIPTSFNKPFYADRKCKVALHNFKILQANGEVSNYKNTLFYCFQNVFHLNFPDCVCFQILKFPFAKTSEDKILEINFLAPVAHFSNQPTGYNHGDSFLTRPKRQTTQAKDSLLQSHLGNQDERGKFHRRTPLVFEKNGPTETPLAHFMVHRKFRQQVYRSSDSYGSARSISGRRQRSNFDSGPHNSIIPTHGSGNITSVGQDELEDEANGSSPSPETSISNNSNSSDSVLFFSLSISIFAFVGVIIFIKRCVRCPPSTDERTYPSNLAAEKSPSPIHTLYNATSDSLQIPFQSFIFNEGGSTPNLQTGAEITSVASRDCMTSPEINYNQNIITPDTPRSFDISHSASNFFLFPSPYSQNTSPSRDTPFGGSSAFPSFDGQSNFFYESDRNIPFKSIPKFDNPSSSPNRMNQIHLNFISSSPSLLQASPHSSLLQSPSRSNVSVGSELICSTFDESDIQKIS